MNFIEPEHSVPCSEELTLFPCAKQQDPVHIFPS